MTIFGRRWPDPNDPLHQDYARKSDAAGPVRYIHVPARGDLLLFRCEACRETYLHWLCSDATWNKLPVKYRRLYLCVTCYRCIRYVTTFPAPGKRSRGKE